MVDRMQTRTEESKNKMKLMATTLQSLIKGTPKEMRNLTTKKGKIMERKRRIIRRWKKKWKRALLKPIHDSTRRSSWETPTKATNTWKLNYQNRDKKDNGSASKKVHTLDCKIGYFPTRTTYTQTLERLLSKGRINLLPIKQGMQNPWKAKTEIQTSVANIIRQRAMILGIVGALRIS
ncbi:hypothetical protein Cgig2_029752 [Carnegiea gigantea]|uniref:Uncharacterized protein n=1 Tax=Carnegiea gigantea TaxID=171969 RepID=A0A9Q1K2Q5_9CARY|nr:hypothetical protein Cgig2_029752 [Carnegiea gigantea]